MNDAEREEVSSDLWVMLPGMALCCSCTAGRC
jgi:hypothetical protein